MKNRIEIKLDKDLKKKFLLLAKQRDSTMTEIITNFIKQYVDEKK